MAQSKIYYFTAILLAVYLTQECNGEKHKERNNMYLFTLSLKLLFQYKNNFNCTYLLIIGWPKKVIIVSSRSTLILLEIKYI